MKKCIAAVSLVTLMSSVSPAFAFNNIGDNYGMPRGSSPAELARNINRSGHGSDIRNDHIGDSYGTPGHTSAEDLMRYSNYNGWGRR